MATDAPVISVNFSPVQLFRINVAALVRKALPQTSLPTNLLEVAITEDVLISNTEKITQTLNELSDMSVSIALDDFGTGLRNRHTLTVIHQHHL